MSEPGGCTIAKEQVRRTPLSEAKLVSDEVELEATESFKYRAEFRMCYKCSTIMICDTDDTKRPKVRCDMWR